MSSEQNTTFHVADYIVFAAFLLVSAGIGISVILRYMILILRCLILISSVFIKVIRRSHNYNCTDRISLQFFGKIIILFNIDIVFVKEERY